MASIDVHSSIKAIRTTQIGIGISINLERQQQNAVNIRFKHNLTIHYG